MTKPAKPADLDREALILSLAQRLRTLSDKAVTNKNISAAVQACTREADLLLSLTPEKPSGGPGGVNVTIAGDDVAHVSPAVRDIERLASRMAEDEKESGRCVRCGGIIGREGAIDVEPLVPANQSTLRLEAQGLGVPEPDPAVLAKPIRKAKPWRDWASFDSKGNRVDGHVGYAERNNGEVLNDDPLSRWDAN
jgi:hypothetical protein